MKNFIAHNVRIVVKILKVTNLKKKKNPFKLKQGNKAVKTRVWKNLGKTILMSSKE